MRGRASRVGAGVLVAALAVALAITIAGCSSQSASTGGSASTGSTTGPIKIGVIVSLSGTNAGLGDPEQKTIQMEVKKINAAGGVNGRKIEAIFEDDGTDNTKAVAAVTKLIEQDKVVAIIGSSGTGQSMAIRNEIDRAGVPQISMAGGNAITGQFDALVFQTPWPNRLVVPFEFAYMQKNKVTKIGVISDSGAFGKDGASTIASEAPKFGITIASSQTFNAGDADMTAQLTVIKKSGAQALLIWSSGKEAATIVKNAKQLGFTMPIYGGHGNARQEFITGTGAAGEGVRIAAGHILVPSTYGTDTAQYKTATDFVSSFQAAYEQPPSTFAGHAFDALYLVVGAAKTIPGEITSSALRDAIEKTNGFAGIGGTFTFSPTDHNGMTAKDLSMYEIKGGAWTLAP